MSHQDHPGHHHDDHQHDDHRHDENEHLTFDDRAATWDDDPEKHKNAREVAAAIADRVPLTRQTRMLEFGAGTGLLTESMQDLIGPAVITDVAEGMLEVMRQKVATGVIRNAQVRRLDLTTEPAPADGFDLVTSLLALHHVDDVETLLTKVRDALVPGGQVAIAELDKDEDHSFHDKTLPAHHGFDRDQLSSRLAAAGFVDIQVGDASHVEKNGRSYPIFLLTGRRD